MSFTDDITKLETWWHEFIGHLFSHPQAAQVAHPAIAAVASAATAVMPSITPKDGQASLLSAYMASGGHVQASDTVYTHDNPDLGEGTGTWYAYTIGPTPALVHFTLSDSDPFKHMKRLVLSANGVDTMTSCHVKVSQNGNVVLEGDALINSGLGGNIARFVVGSLPAGKYDAEILPVGKGDVGITLANV